MFGRGFALEILKPTAEGNPPLVARPVLWSAQVVLSQPQLWNTLFALTQLLLDSGCSGAAASRSPWRERSSGR